MKTCLSALLLFIAIAPAFAGEERPLPRRKPPFAKGYAEKIELFSKRLTLRTRDGDQSFVWGERTYFFRAKQKISPEQLKVGELIALRYVATPEGDQFIQRLKVIPPEPPAAP